MTHCMVDIETLGTKPGSVILTIGAVIFDAREISYEFEVVIDLKSSMDAGLTLEADTICWWMRQDGKAIGAAFNQFAATPVKDALTALFEWSQDHGVTHWWSHGATFDIVLLDEAARRVGAPSAITDFRSARDTRTLFEATGIEVKKFRGPDGHVAINDARAQAAAVIAAWRQLEHWKKGFTTKVDGPFGGVMEPIENSLKGSPA